MKEKTQKKTHKLRNNFLPFYKTNKNEEIKSLKLK